MSAINAVDLSPARLAKLLQRLDLDVATAGAAEGRRMRGERGLLTICHTHGEGLYLAPVTEFGSGGMRFLVQWSAPAGTRCVLHLRTAAGGRQDIPGKVVECRAVEESVFEAMMRFDRSSEASGSGQLAEPAAPEAA